MLHHISDLPDITRFDPRPVAAASVTPLTPEGAMVWAVDEQHVHNYYLPRDCPRVTFYALPTSSAEDVERLLGQSTARYIVAIESGWFKEVTKCRLSMSTSCRRTASSFRTKALAINISHEPVTPLAVRPINDLLGELLKHDVELHILLSLGKLRDAVVGSTLQFSIIRWRNARPKDGTLGLSPLP
jgi:hypothetical protein